MSLPAGWSLATIDDVTEGRVDQRAPTKPARYIDIGSIDRESKRVGNASFVEPADAPTRARQWVRAGDVLVSMTRPNLNAVAIVDNPFDGAVASTGFDILRAKGVLPKWLYYRVRSDAFVRDICDGVQGVVYPAVRPADVRRHVLPIAPLPEQARIVEAVESYLSRLDDAVASLKRAQARLKAYRASVLKAAVEGRLVPTEAALARAEKRGYEPAEVLLKRILAQRRRRWEQAELAKMIADGKPPKDERWKARYSAPESPDVAGLPDLPEGWCWSSVDQLAADQSNALTDGPFGSHLKTSHYTASGPRVIRLQNIGDGEFIDAKAHISEERFASLRKHRVEPGDLVMASLGADLPRACRVPEWIGHAIVKADCLRFSVEPKLAEANYVMHALNSPGTRQRTEALVHGVGRPRIGLALMRSVPVPLPPLREQQRILEAVDGLESLGRATFIDIQRDCQRVNRLRQAILAWAFAGRLVDHDSTDHPAVVAKSSQRT